MVLVLFLLGVLITLTTIVIILIFSNIKINIKKLEIENILLPKLTYDYNIQIGIYLFSAIPFFMFNITPKILKKLKIIEKIKQNHINEKVIFDLDIIKKVKMASVKIKELNLNLKVGTEDAVITSAIVFAISTILSIGLPHLVKRNDYNKIKYEITPLYSGRNIFSLKANSIIYVKMVHIINIIYIFLRKRREEKNERASNRRSYANCNEQYTRYGRC